MKGRKRKFLAIFSILLFIGMNYIPIINGSENHLNSLENKDDHLINDFSFNRRIAFLMRLGGLPSLSVCIIKNSDIVWSEAYGFSHVYLRKKATLDKIYMIGSISKSITAIALMQLYENCLFDLDDNVSEWLPFDLKNPKYPDINITFRMLLAHQSSLFEFALLRPSLSFDYIKNLSKIFRIFFKSLPYIQESSLLIENILNPNGSAYSEDIWMDFPPGSESKYSDLGFIILGYLLEQIANQSIEQYCKENIFLPLGMMNTSYHPNDLARKRLIRPYDRICGRPVPLPHYDFFAAASAGGIRTTLEDLSHLLLAHMNDGAYNGVRVLENNTLCLMHKIQYPGSYFQNHQFGLGWEIWKNDDGDRYEGHIGSGPGSYALMKMRSSDNTGIIFMTNYRSVNSKFGVKIMSLIEQAFFEKAEEF